MNHHSRREFLKALGFGAAALSVPRTACAEGPSAERPNIVLILSDDQGWGDYGFMNHPAIQTPNLDRLAAEGVTFTRGYVAAPLCCPSLASIITGLHPHQHKITSNDPPKLDGKKWTPERLALREKMISHIDNVPSLPRTLKEKGYVSLQTGKWWLGDPSRGGFTQGMTHADPKRGGRHGDAGLAIGRDTMQPIHDFIAQAGDRPFFLWYAPMMPHNPHNPPDRLVEKYKAKTPSLHIARYWAMCEWFDESCGQLLDHLDQKGIGDNTIVLYVCDNGWVQSEDSGKQVQGSKGWPYDAGVRSPIMVRWRARVKPRRDDVTPVSSTDLAPTVLAACGMAPAPEMQGVNLLDEKVVAGRGTVFGAAYSHDAVDVDDPTKNLQWRWCVRGWWKLILSRPERVPAAAVREPQLFDLKADPHEKANLASQRPDVVQELTALIDRWYRPA
ncbi:MAG: sulfatase [Planctomycetota bacterium]